MSLETTATYIDSLNIAWPDGSDVRSTADDHMRLIKGSLKRTFPNITNVINLAQAQFDQLAAGSVSFSVMYANAVNSPNLSAAEPGYKGTPLNSQNGNYGILLTDCGKEIFYNGAGGHTYTIPANASVAIPVGTRISITNFSASTLAIVITTDNLFLTGTSSSGARVLAATGECVISKKTLTSWFISGAGVS